MDIGNSMISNFEDDECVVAGKGASGTGYYLKGHS